MRFLGAPIISVYARRMAGNQSAAMVEDKVAITLGFEDGSFGTIHYLANGGPSFPKERVEVFAAGHTQQLDNFRKLRGYNWPKFRKHRLWRQDKGQTACAAAFVEAVIKGGPPPIPQEELFEVAQASIDVANIISSQK